jgi:hypothetical protein
MAVLVTAIHADGRCVVSHLGRRSGKHGLRRQGPTLQLMLRHSRVDGRDKHGHDPNAAWRFKMSATNS